MEDKIDFIESNVKFLTNVLVKKRNIFVGEPLMAWSNFECTELSMMMLERKWSASSSIWTSSPKLIRGRVRSYSFSPYWFLLLSHQISTHKSNLGERFFDSTHSKSKLVLSDFQRVWMFEVPPLMLFRRLVFIPVNEGQLCMTY